MPRFKDEASRQRWMAARWGGEAKARAKAKRPDPLPDDLPITTNAVTVSPVAGVVVATLDDKIAQLQADLAVLEQAREILSRS